VTSVGVFAFFIVNTKQVIENYKLQNFVNTITDDKMSVKTSATLLLNEKQRFMKRTNSISGLTIAKSFIMNGL
jgi:hypothetical protein